MQRDALLELLKWKKEPCPKPLIIRGARQVGKTWLMKEFGKAHFKNVAYINFETSDRLKNIFNDDHDIKRILTSLQIETGIIIEPQNTLIIFDEVQEAPRAITSLKYFNEEAPEYHIIAAGSLLGVAMHPGTSFPVGKVAFLDLYPLSFLEFLAATGNNSLVELLTKNDFKMVTTFKTKYINLLKQYYFVGGMPEAVSVFIEKNDFNAVREVQNRLLIAYEQDFSKHAPREIIPRVNMIWASISAQLAKENRKFIYGLIKQGARAKEFELTIQWLLDAGLIHKVSRISKPGIPITAYQDFNAFKLFILDVGLLSAISGLNAKTLLDGNNIFTEFKGSLTEQFVLQQLITQKIKAFYWSAESSSGEIDFVFQAGENVVPLEVKAEENLQAKSLKSYKEKFKPKYAMRTSMSNYRQDEWLINLPLYAINCLLSCILSFE